jgi:hypothetical protein
MALNGDKTHIVNLFSNHAGRLEQSLPSWIDVRCFRQDWEQQREFRSLGTGFFR